jgi:hypothetical protein
MNGELRQRGALSGGNALFCHEVYGTKGYIYNPFDEDSLLLQIIGI